ncbi:hypothetical protein [Allosphingosinicella indica]|uniref:Uncharacterized protein n=1 Tax=Allosphingosinicella indica TaxID=941907 RepID=A0A1X7GIV2_9SPHN|nr:hypothetical protein [Allosphingosinicella indica]SMF70485.1 hypothetical protein SAMN06295910_1879 [Allosphingosinicella indica]
MTKPYVFQRGETISLALDAIEGDAGSVSAIAADLRPLSNGRVEATEDAPIAASFTISDRAAEGDDPGGFNLVITAAFSADLSPGLYIADARVTVAGGVIVTDPVTLRIAEPVTRP